MNDKEQVFKLFSEVAVLVLNFRSDNWTYPLGGSPPPKGRHRECYVEIVPSFIKKIK